MRVLALQSLILALVASLPSFAGRQSPAAGDLAAGIGADLAPAASVAATGIHLGSADSTVALAFRHHPRIRALIAEAEAARAERTGGRVLPNPEADLAFRKSGGESHWELGILGDVNGLLLYPWKRGAANLHYRAAIARLAAEASRQRADIRSAYYRAVAADHLKALVAQASATWDAAAELAGRQREAGTMSALDLAEVRAAAVEARLDLRSAEASAFEEREILARMLGIPSGNWTLPERLPDPHGVDPEPASLERLALSRNAGIVAAREEVAAVEKAHALSRLEVIPSLKAGVSLERDEAGRNFAGPAIAAEIPLFDLGIPRRARTRAQRDVGRERLAVAEMDMGPDLRRRYHAMVTARGSHEEAVGALVPLREQATAEALKHYNFMLTGVYRLLTTRREELAARRMAVEALRDYWIERTELEHLVGGALPSGPAASTDYHDQGDAQ